MLGSLAANIAILDKAGNIVAVNDAWKRFARENGDPSLTGTGVGINYLDVCRRAARKSASEAQQVLVGIEAILEGSQRRCTVEYPCHSPTEKRWFLMHATPLAWSRGGPSSRT